MGFDGCIENLALQLGTWDLNENKQAKGVSPGCPAQVHTHQPFYLHSFWLINQNDARLLKKTQQNIYIHNNFIMFLAMTCLSVYFTIYNTHSDVHILYLTYRKFRLTF